MNEKVILIGIAGGTGSGKTTIANNIIAELSPQTARMIDYDSYYKDLSHLSIEERKKVNFDHPNAMDNDLFYNHLNLLKSRQAIDKPVYNYMSHTRMDEAVKIEPKPVIIVEGLLLFVEKRIRNLFDIKLFVDTDADVRVLRRIRRDLHERGRSLESIERQYMISVRPMHLEFVEPSKRWADLIIPEGGFNQVARDMIIARINNLSETE